MGTSEIRLPKVAHHFKDKEAGEQVDKVLNVLKQEMRSYQAPDAATVEGKTVAAVVSRDLFFQAFEDDVTESWNFREGVAADVSYTTNGIAGGVALAVSSEVQLAFPENVVFDPDRLYRIRTRFRRTGASVGTDTVRVGVEGVGADGTTLVDRTGGVDTDAMHNVAAAEDATSYGSGTWTTLVGYFKGTSAPGDATSPSTNASAPRVLHEDVRYIRPFFHLNEGGGSTPMELDFIAIEVLTETPEVDDLLSDVGGRTPGEVGSTVRSGCGVAAGGVYRDSLRSNIIQAAHIEAGTITAAEIAANTITANEILAGTITANEIAADTITAAEIAADTITANELLVSQLSAISADVGTLTAGILQNAAGSRYVDLDGTSGFFIKADQFEVDNAGNASFSGDLSAASGTFGTITAGELQGVVGAMRRHYLETGGTTTSGTSEEDLMSTTLPTMGNDDVAHMYAAGKVLTGGSTKHLRVYLDAVEILHITYSAHSREDWAITGTLIGRDAPTGPGLPPQVRTICILNFDGDYGGGGVTRTVELTNFASGAVLKITGQTANSAEYVEQTAFLVNIGYE